MRQKNRKNRDNRGTSPAGPRKQQAPKPRLKIDLFGMHAVQAAWRNPQRFIHALYITDSALKDFDLAPDLKRPKPTLISREELDRALPVGSVHQGIALSCQPLDEISVEDLIIQSSHTEKSTLVMLDQVTDPHNVGAILRTACAFGANGLILQKKHAPEPKGILAKTACGALEHVPLAYETNLTRTLEKLQEAGFTVIGLDERGDEEVLNTYKSHKTVLVLGAEGPGLRRLVKEQCNLLARLPMHGPMPSINVSNAAAIALYALNAKVQT